MFDVLKVKVDEIKGTELSFDRRHHYRYRILGQRS